SEEVGDGVADVIKAMVRNAAEVVATPEGVAEIPGNGGGELLIERQHAPQECILTLIYEALDRVHDAAEGESLNGRATRVLLLGTLRGGVDDPAFGMAGSQLLDRRHAALVARCIQGVDEVGPQSTDHFWDKDAFARTHGNETVVTLAGLVAQDDTALGKTERLRCVLVDLLQSRDDLRSLVPEHHDALVENRVDQELDRFLELALKLRPLVTDRADCRFEGVDSLRLEVV